MKLFVARFWSDFKESEAVCLKYFCEAVPFWEWEEMSAGMSQVFDLNPQPSGKRRLRHPQNRRVA